MCSLRARDLPQRQWGGVWGIKHVGRKHVCAHARAGACLRTRGGGWGRAGALTYQRISATFY